MTYALLTSPPVPLKPGCDYDLKDGKRYSLSALAGMTESERRALGVATIEQPPALGPVERIVSDKLSLVDGVPTIVRKTETISMSERKQQMLAELANKRWQVENGGIQFGMAAVATDDRSKLMISAARTKAKEDPAYTTRWKVAPGQFVTLDAPTLIAFGDAIEAHVSACFEHEEALSDQIASAKTHAALDAIDITTGWPE